MSVTYKKYTQYLVKYTFNNSNLIALQLRPLSHHGWWPNGFIGGEIYGTKIMGLSLRSLVQEGLF